MVYLHNPTDTSENYSVARHFQMSYNKKIWLILSVKIVSHDTACLIV
jgi:hypothetical protein